MLPMRARSLVLFPEATMCRFGVPLAAPSGQLRMRVRLRPLTPRAQHAAVVHDADGARRQADLRGPRHRVHRCHQDVQVVRRTRTSRQQPATSSTTR